MSLLPEPIDNCPISYFRLRYSGEPTGLFKYSGKLNPYYYSRPKLFADGLSGSGSVN
jgi:hypothetical protein